MRFERPRQLLTRPSVSVVVPCYNYGHYLGDAVSGVLDQDGLDVEVIIVDDASPDGSVGAARELAAVDERVQVIAHTTNKGHIATYNDGLREIKGDYVVLLSADDALPRNSLTRSIALMEHHPEVGMVYGFPDNFTETPPDVPDRVRSWTTWHGREWFRRACRTGRNVVMNPEVVMRRAAWDEVGEYDPRLPHAADMALWLSTSLRWDIGRVNGPVQGLYRVHGQNMHLTTFAGMVRDLRERALVFDLLFAEDRPLPPDAADLHERARRALAETAIRLAMQDGVDVDPHGSVEAFEEFACESWPGITGTSLWRRHQDTRLTDTTAPVRFQRKVRTHLAWRRWRRYGL